MIKSREFIGKAKVIPQRNALLLPYQQKWVLDKSRLKIMEKSRQIGISWATAYSLVRRKAMKDAQLDAWVSSRDEIQARLFLEDCKAFSNILNAGAEDLGEQVFDDKGSTGFVLRMANSLRINSMSSSPDAQAGKRGDRALDEFALHKDPRKLYSVAYPGITWGGQLEILSTHRGKDNFFNEIIVEVKEKGNPKGFSLHRVTLQDALDQGFLYKLQSKLPLDDERQQMDESEYFDFIRSGCADEDSFQQEYMCVPVDSDSIFMSYDLIVPCEYDSSEKWEIDLSTCKDGFYVGVDVGRKHDLTVVWANEICGGRFMTRKIIELKNMKFSEQEKIIYPILALPNMRRACFDASGLGMQLAERAQEKFGNYRIEPVTFTAQTKEALAYPLKAAFEDRNVRMPFRPEIRQDLRGIKKETTAAGNVRFCGDRGTNGHSDRFWALALSIHAASTADLGPCRMEPAMMTGDNKKDNWMKPDRQIERPDNWKY
jgi:phage FluMu gp28-like protein